MRVAFVAMARGIGIAIEEAPLVGAATLYRANWFPP